MGQPGHVVFAYPEQPKERHRRLRLHEIRDGHAHLLLSPLFFDLPCRGIFINNPYPIKIGSGEQERQIREELLGIPLVCIATRPPLDDPEAPWGVFGAGRSSEADKIRKTIARSHNWLEGVIFKRLRTVFAHCDRKRVEIRLLPAIPNGGMPDCERFEFQQTDEAFVVGETWSIGFFVYLNELWADGPDLCCAYGMSGPMTMIWCHLLANSADCRKRLRLVPGARGGVPSGQSRFVVARIVPTTRIIPVDAHCLSFADDWSVSPVVDIVWPDKHED